MKGGIRSRFALVWVSALVLAAVALVALNESMEHPARAVPHPAPATITPTVAEATVPEAAPAATPSAVVPQPAVISSAPVTVLDLDHLAAAVNLREPNMGASKQAWAAQLPVAEGLLQRPCDCDQRNWLKHFVKTANEAVSGSEDYPHSVQLLATLRRSDADLTLSGASAR